MAFSKTFFGAVSMVALLLAGCSSTRFASEDSRPAPLQPAPSGTVTATALPPPVAPGPVTDPAQFPAAPATTDVAALPGSVGAAAGPDLTTGSVAGVWNATVSGQSCKVATPQTKFGAGYRAGPLRCPAPVDGVKSWNVAGNQLSLYDESGSVLARLQSSGEGKFDGQTSTGLPISLSR
jgi:hypothetical protein